MVERGYPKRKLDERMLVQGVLAGDRLALAKAISIVENEAPEAIEILEETYPHAGKAYRIGVTGPLGVGKSTLIDELAHMLVKEGATIGILAIDPTSPFTGGALLGDRIRMQRVSSEPAIFIRSMATRGALGGLSKHAHQVCDLMDASGKDYIIVETVGVGQSEVDVTRTVDTTVLILSPESGDGIQAMKAGLMEAADVFVVNKADRPGAFNIEEEIRLLIEMSARGRGWKPPVIRAEAHRGVGVAEVLQSIKEHMVHLGSGDEIKKRRRVNLKIKIQSLFETQLRERLLREPLWNSEIENAVGRIERGEETPYRAVGKLIARFFGDGCNG